jgi:hypothetical protein
MKRQHPTDQNLFWCPRCEEYKEQDDYYIDKRYGRPTGWCKPCMNSVKKPIGYEKNRSARRRLQNPDKYREYKRIWARNHPSDWRAREKGKIKIISKKYWKKNIENLTDAYIKNQIANQYHVTFSNITPETIELKRQQIIMKRTLKQFKQWRKENENESNHTDVHGKQHADEENHERRV